MVSHTAAVCFCLAILLVALVAGLSISSLNNHSPLTNSPHNSTSNATSAVHHVDPTNPYGLPSVRLRGLQASPSPSPSPTTSNDQYWYIGIIIPFTVLIFCCIARSCAYSPCNCRESPICCCCNTQPTILTTEPES